MIDVEINIDYNMIDKLSEEERIKQLVEIKQGFFIAKQTVNAGIKLDKKFIKVSHIFNALFLLLAGVCLWFDIYLTMVLTIGAFVFSIRNMLKSKSNIENHKENLEYILEKERELENYIERCEIKCIARKF